MPRYPGLNRRGSGFGGPKSPRLTRRRLGSRPGRRPARRSRRRTTRPGPPPVEGMSTPGSSGATLRLGERPRRRSRASATARARGGTGRASARRRGGAPRARRPPGPRAVGQRVLHPGRRTSIPRSRARKTISGLGVEPRDLGVGVARRAGGGPSRRFRPRAPGLAPAATGSRRWGAVLELVVTRDLGPDLVQVGLGVDVELCAQVGLPRRWPPR